MKPLTPERHGESPGTFGGKITPRQLASILIKEGIVQAAAIEDPEGYDRGKTVIAITKATHQINVARWRSQRLVIQRNAWLEEYRACGCTFMARTKRELLGYCQKHGNDRRRITRMPCAADMEMGHAG